MKVLILGGSGMLGHKLVQVLSERFDVRTTFRGTAKPYARYGLFTDDRVIEGVSAGDFDTVIAALAKARPDVVVNAIGVVKQSGLAKDPVPSIAVNSLFPHRLAQLCRAAGARLIHVSTDCVFSGRKGNYVETDAPDPEDLYGRSKHLGELGPGEGLTLRTSMIGRELGTAHGLIEWFLGQRGRSVRGFKKAIFSGFTTQALAELIGRVIAEWPRLEGVWHVAADPINKYDLLQLARQQYRLDVRVEPDETVVCDRSLDAGRFRAETGYAPPDWPTMIARLAQDTTYSI
jgi:dTDP-4-dehydrorhamnose reductase